MGPFRPLTPGQVLAATGLGPECRLVWMGTEPSASFNHLCPDLHGHSELVFLAHRPTSTLGVEVATCERCRIAWVRTVGG